MKTTIRKGQARNVSLAVLSAVAGAVWAFGAGPARAQTTRTYAGANNGDWFTATNWTPNDAYPQAGDTAIVAANTVLLTNATASLAAMIVTNTGAVAMSNLQARIVADDVRVYAANGITHGVNSATNAVGGEWIMNALVWIQCQTLTVYSNASIGVDEKGFTGGAAVGENGRGPGGGITANNGEGGAYGGRGDHRPGYAPASNAAVYGVASDAAWCGSGGGAETPGSGKGGAGGGRIRIEASGTVTVNGTLSANGLVGTGQGGSGSGGGIYVSASSLAGSGTIRANGGGTLSWSMAGGGGRIAINAPVSSGWSGVVQAKAGVLGHATSGLWQHGTLYFPNGHQFSSGGLNTNWYGRIYGASNSVIPGLAMNGNYLAFEEPNGAITVTGEVHVRNGAVFRLGTSVGSFYEAFGSAVSPRSTSAGAFDLTVGGDFVVSNATFSVFAAATNGLGAYGASVTVGGALRVETNAAVYLYSNPTNGGSAKFQAGSFALAKGATINANYKGFGNNMGPGKPVSGSFAGAGYGGKGGNDTWAVGVGGNPYGSSNAPAECGSGGYQRNAHAEGGGLVRIEAAGGNIVLDGTITANGNGDPGDRGGAGSGGGICLIGRRFSGSGTLRANGGATPDHSGGGGGGGRIAVWAGQYGDTNGITATVTGGAGASQSGADGTLVWGTIRLPGGTVITIR